MSPVYSPNAAAITALAVLTLSSRVRATVQTFQADPDSKLTHSDYSVISRLLALLSPKPGEDPSPDYVDTETAALYVFETRIRSINRRMAEDPATPFPGLIYRVVSKAVRLITAREKREQFNQSQTQSLASGLAGEGGLARSPQANARQHAAAEQSARGLEAGNAPSPAQQRSSHAPVSLDTHSQQTQNPANILPPQPRASREARRELARSPARDPSKQYKRRFPAQPPGYNHVP